jgi:hypothetical protein
MAEKPKTLLEGGAADALGEGAARFEKVIEGVKRQHAVTPEPTRAPAANPLLSAGPGEEWARRYQSQAIGPMPDPLSAGELAPVPRALIMRAITPENPILSRAAEIAPKVSVGAPDIRFGRGEKPRKSWLGRMFSRR